MSATEWLGLAVALLLLAAWTLTYSAARLDRLHARVEGTLAALDAQLVRRAEATLELANSGTLDPASALMLADAASESLEAAALEDADSARLVFPRERAAVESDLTEALGLALSAESVAHVRSCGAAAQDALQRVQATGQRVQLARRFHNDAVTAVRRTRRNYFVALFRLAGHADLPRTVEFADELPAALRG